MREDSKIHSPALYLPDADARSDGLVVDLYPGHGLVRLPPRWPRPDTQTSEPAPSTPSERAGIHMLAQHDTATIIREGKGWRTKVCVLFDMSRIVCVSCVSVPVGFLAAQNRMKGFGAELGP